MRANLSPTEVRRSRETFEISESSEVTVKDNKRRRRIMIILLLLILAILVVLIIVLGVILTRSKPEAVNSSDNITFVSTIATSPVSSSSSWTIPANETKFTTQIISSAHSSMSTTITIPTTILITTTTITTATTTTTTTATATTMTTTTTTTTTTATATTMTTTTTTTTTTTSRTSTPNFNYIINGGFETGDTNGWIIGGGSRIGIQPSMIVVQDYLPGGSSYNSAIANTHSRIVTRTIDPLLLNSMPVPVRNGNYALRVEDTMAGGFLSVATQTVNNYGSPNIYFAWLAVVEISGHTTDDSSLLLIELKDVTNGTVLLRRRYNSDMALSADTSRFVSNGNYFYTPSWQIENVFIQSSHLGHSFSLTILVTDCGQSGHLAYMYIDDFGPTAP